MPRKQLFLGISTVVGLTAIFVALILDLRRTAELRQVAVGWQAHTERVLDVGNALSDSLRDYEIAQRGFLLTHDRRYQELAAQGRAVIAPAQRSIRFLTRDNPAQQANLRILNRLIATRTVQVDRTIAQATDGHLAEAIAFIHSGQGLRAMQAYRAVLGRVLQIERHLLTERTATVTRDEQAVRRSLAGLAVLGAALLLASLAALAYAARQIAAAREQRWAEGQQRADRQEEEFCILADNIPQLTWMADPTGHVNWYSARWHEFSGVELATANGDEWRALHDPELVDSVVERCTTAFATGAPWEDSFPLRDVAGEYRWFLCRAVPVRDTAGAITRWFGTNTDITEQRRIERDLSKAKQAADAANAAKSQFLANMSHELRTPLNAVIGYSEMLRDDAEDLGVSELTGDLDKINRAGRTLLSLVNDVLDLSKIEAGKMDLYEEEVALGAFVTDVSGTAEPLMAKNRNRLAIVAPDKPLTMRVDVTKLRQIALNLLSNAAKFTTDGTVTLSFIAAPAGELVLAVADQGIGMTQQQIGRLFQAFSQADESTTRNFGGTGLGLALTKTLAELMGGSIAVASEPGQGTTFTVRLPGVLHGVVADGKAMIDFSEVLPSPVAERLAGSLVLVIDDDPHMHELMTRLLARDGLQIASAVDGEAGLIQARALQPAVITLDVTMPGMDGWHVLARLKADPATEAIPVVMLTMVQDRIMAKALGASEYLTKPIDREALHQVLERQVGRGEEPATADETG